MCFKRQALCLIHYICDGYVKPLGETQSRAELLSRTGEHPSLFIATRLYGTVCLNTRERKGERVMPLSQVMLSVSLICSVSMSNKSNWSTLGQGTRQMCMAYRCKESLDIVPWEKKSTLITSELKRKVVKRLKQWGKNSCTDLTKRNL